MSLVEPVVSQNGSSDCVDGPMLVAQHVGSGRTFCRARVYPGIGNADAGAAAKKVWGIVPAFLPENEPGKMLSDLWSLKRSSAKGAASSQ